ncbi:primary-amine oxidase [Fusarium mundagurra]|uniref:Amine oxidase n=1 Tax=Fusarium mundagurra TaxID=1567541 RepID=A0A8H6D3Z4_9HYPO|nr:primary-amine oxidase [Fusarium mundagurra]
MSGSVPHPFDPLSGEEIRLATSIVRKEHGDAVHFHVITLQEPRKAEMVAWLANPSSGARPRRVAEVVIIDPRDGKGHVYDGLVDLKSQRITKWERAEGQQPILIVEEMLEVEEACRKDPKVIEQCRISGIAADEMHKVYADPWTISHDPRYGSSTRLFQGLMYFRPDVDNCQYQYPLDFHPIYDPRKKEIIAIDIPRVRRPLQRNKAVDYHHLYIQNEGGYRKDLKPIYISQPEGVSFNVNGRELEWQNWKFHIGFNYREGIVFNNITFNDKGSVRPIFYRMSLSEMVVPYGHPEPPHHRKHAFDLGEYGAGYLTNSLSLGCDCKGMLPLTLQLLHQANCKGAIHYLDAELPTQTGQIRKIENAICIHEEDDGILFKHTDFRDNSTIVTRARKLIVQHVFTAANYEYAIQWVFHQDGTIQPDIKLTGILNTYVMNPGEDLQGYGTQVKKGVNAHNHQHLFLLRINPSIDGHENTVHMVDAVPSDAPVGSPDNLYGNAFYAKRTRLETTGQAITDYNGATSRSWDIVNENKLNSASGKPVSYKLVSRDVPNLMPKEGSLVWKRAFFARHAVHVTKYADDELWAAGNHVAQSSGEPARGLGAWIGDGTKSVANTDIVLWHTFGITHFPAPEDFPVMPAEPITLLLRPRHFFTCNPVMDVPPSYSVTPSEVAAKKSGFDTTDKVSKLAAMSDSSCCKPPKL